MKIIPKLIILIDSQKIKSGLVTLGPEPRIDKVREFDWTAETLPEVFKKIKSQYKISEARMVLGEEISFLTELSIPKDVTNERSFIGLKGSEKFPEVLESENWDFKTIGETKTQKQIKIYAIQKQLLEKISSAVKISGLFFEIIEPFILAEKRNSDPMIGLAMKYDIISNPETGKEISDISEKKEFMETEQQEVKPEIPITAVKERKPKKFKTFLIIFGIIILVGALVAGGIILSQKSLKKTSGENNSPTVAQAPPTSSPIVTPTVMVTPTSAISKKELKINILNGSGIAGLAGKAKTYLEGLGYTVANTGNAEVFTYETTEVSIKEAKKAFLGELLKSMEEKYTLSETNPVLDSKSEYDIVIKLGKK